MGLSELEEWFQQNLLLLVAVAALLVVLYAYSGRFVRTTVRRALRASEGDFTGSGVEDAELEKRATTIESLTTTLIRGAIVAVGIFIFIGILGAWSFLTLIGLFLAGMAIAGQPIVLDYLMGTLIIIEGQFFQGDNIEVGGLPWKGTVESVGLRRTVVRDPDGTVYSISNGELRSVANRTRVYAAAEVRIRGIRERDLRRVVELMDEVGREIASDPEFSDAIIEAPALKFVEDPDDLGTTAVMRGKVTAADRWRVATEIRLRLNDALVRNGIALNKRVLAADAGTSQEPRT